MKTEHVCILPDNWFPINKKDRLFIWNLNYSEKFELCYPKLVVYIVNKITQNGYKVLLATDLNVSCLSNLYKECTKDCIKGNIDHCYFKDLSEINTTINNYDYIAICSSVNKSDSFLELKSFIKKNKKTKCGFIFASDYFIDRIKRKFKKICVSNTSIKINKYEWKIKYTNKGLSIVDDINKTIIRNNKKSNFNNYFLKKMKTEKEHIDNSVNEFASSRRIYTKNIPTVHINENVVKEYFEKIDESKKSIYVDTSFESDKNRIYVWDITVKQRQKLSKNDSYDLNFSKNDLTNEQRARNRIIKTLDLSHIDPDYWHKYAIAKECIEFKNVNSSEDLDSIFLQAIYKDFNLSLDYKFAFRIIELIVNNKRYRINLQITKQSPINEISDNKNSQSLLKLLLKSKKTIQHIYLQYELGNKKVIHKIFGEGEVKNVNKIDDDHIYITCVFKNQKAIFNEKAFIHKTIKFAK